MATATVAQSTRQKPKRPSQGQKFFPLGPQKDGINTCADKWDGRPVDPIQFARNPVLVSMCAAVDPISVRADPISSSVDPISVPFFPTDPISTLF